MKKLLSLISLFTLLLILNISCKKETQTFSISGNIYDPQLKTVLSGVTVILLGNKVESGVFNANFTELARATSDASGNYSIELKDQKVAAYKFNVLKTNYFDYSEAVNTDVLQVSNTFSKNFQLFPQSTIQINIKNTSPQSMDDQIKWRFINANQNCKTCCNSLWTTGVGPTYMQTTECLVVGERYLNFEWIVTKNGSQHYFKDSVMMAAFQLKTYSINY